MNKTFLIKEYQTKSVTQIAKENNIYKSTLYHIFDRLNIKRRNQKEAGALRIVKHSCIDCGTQVSRKEYIRCKDCEIKNKPKQAEYFCIKCGSKISKENGLSGLGRCPSCANKGKNNPMAGKRNFLSIHHIDLNRDNNKKDNLLKIPQGIHSSLHHRSYDYLVEKGLITDYIEWFFKKFTIDLNEKG